MGVLGSLEIGTFGLIFRFRRNNNSIWVANLVNSKGHDKTVINPPDVAPARKATPALRLKKPPYGGVVM
jgi:hypothetical protein